MWWLALERRVCIKAGNSHFRWAYENKKGILPYVDEMPLLSVLLLTKA